MFQHCEDVKRRENIKLEAQQLVSNMEKLPCCAPLMITVCVLDWLFGLASTTSTHPMGEFNSKKYFSD